VNVNPIPSIQTPTQLGVLHLNPQRTFTLLVNLSAFLLLETEHNVTGQAALTAEKRNAYGLEQVKLAYQTSRKA